MHQWLSADSLLYDNMQNCPHEAELSHPTLFLRYQSSGQGVGQRLNWWCQGAVVGDQPWAGAVCTISKDTRQSRFPCWKTLMGTECSLPHKAPPNQIICLWFFPKSGSGPPSGVKSAPTSLICNPTLKFKILWTATNNQSNNITFH